MHVYLTFSVFLCDMSVFLCDMSVFCATVIEEA